MANWAVYVVVPDEGGHEVYEARFGAVGLDLDLLAGPGVVLPLLRGRDLVAGDDWRHEGVCEAAVLIDVRRRKLVLYASEGPTTQMRQRAACLELLRMAWPGWELCWAYDGPRALRVYLGLDPEGVRDPLPKVYADGALDVDDEELRDVDPWVRVVTIGGDRCHVLSAVNDHPIAEGPALLHRLAEAPNHGVCSLAAQSGIHVDPVRRHVGWWLLGAAAPGPLHMAERWPGWHVEFWRDQWTEHVMAADGRFAPPPVNRELALTEVRQEAVEHWTRQPREPGFGWMQDRTPDTLVSAVVAATLGSVGR